MRLLKTCFWLQIIFATGFATTFCGCKRRVIHKFCNRNIHKCKNLQSLCNSIEVTKFSTALQLLSGYKVSNRFAIMVAILQPRFLCKVVVNLKKKLKLILFRTIFLFKVIANFKKIKNIFNHISVTRRL